MLGAVSGDILRFLTDILSSCNWVSDVYLKAQNGPKNPQNMVFETKS